MKETSVSSVQRKRHYKTFFFFTWRGGACGSPFASAFSPLENVSISNPYLFREHHFTFVLARLKSGGKVPATSLLTELSGNRCDPPTEGLEAPMKRSQ
jgi:hypothetical protein